MNYRASPPVCFCFSSEKDTFKTTELGGHQGKMRVPDEDIRVSLSRLLVRLFPPITMQQLVKGISCAFHFFPQPHNHTF